jgi:hypothetical protein
MSYAIPRVFKWVIAALIGLPLLATSEMALSANAFPDTELASCEYLKDATVVQSLRDLPPALRKDILSHRPLLADHGQRFRQAAFSPPALLPSASSSLPRGALVGPWRMSRVGLLTPLLSWPLSSEAQIGTK